MVIPELAERNGIEVGDEISLPLYSLTYDLTRNIIYTPLIVSFSLFIIDRTHITWYYYTDFLEFTTKLRKGMN